MTVVAAGQQRVVQDYRVTIAPVLEKLETIEPFLMSAVAQPGTDVLAALERSLVALDAWTGEVTPPGRWRQSHDYIVASVRKAVEAVSSGFTGDREGKAREAFALRDAAKRSLDGSDSLFPASDAVIIKDGVLTEFMNSLETSARLGIRPTGSARAYLPSDEPLVRMRNTAILPGESKLDDMIAGIDDGYVLLRTGNGQADSTTEFMFAISLGYEVKNGRIGRAIKDTTMSGSAIKVLSSADAVSDDMKWNSGGYCGKKQPMVVSMGGPAIRAQVHMGGE